jgi:hypothetical protein
VESEVACKHCMFFEYSSGEVGDCRIYPPVTYQGDDGSFPIVCRDWWCGEFLDKPLEPVLGPPRDNEK